MTLITAPWFSVSASTNIVSPLDAFKNKTSPANRAPELTAPAAPHQIAYNAPLTDEYRGGPSRLAFISLHYSNQIVIAPISNPSHAVVAAHQKLPLNQVFMRSHTPRALPPSGDSRRPRR